MLNPAKCYDKILNMNYKKSHFRELFRQKLTRKIK